MHPNFERVSELAGVRNTSSCKDDNTRIGIFSTSIRIAGLWYLQKPWIAGQGGFIHFFAI